MMKSLWSYKKMKASEIQNWTKITMKNIKTNPVEVKKKMLKMKMKSVCYLIRYHLFVRTQYLNILKQALARQWFILSTSVTIAGFNVIVNMI